MNWFTCHCNEEVAHVRVTGEIGFGAGAGDLLLAIGGAQKVRFYINSPGGNTSDALAIYDGLQGRDVEVEIGGRCYSAAVIVAMLGRVIRAESDSGVMLHAAVDHCVGDADMLRCAANRMEKFNGRLVAIVAARTRQPESTVAQWYRSGVDSYFTAAEAQAVGLVDEILKPVEKTPRREAVDMPGTPAAKPGFTDAERLLMDFLRALGPLETHDKGRLGRELGVWFNYQVKG